MLEFRSLFLELKTLFFMIAITAECYPEMNTKHWMKIHHTLHALSFPTILFLLISIMIYQFIFTEVKL